MTELKSKLKQFFNKPAANHAVSEKTSFSNTIPASKITSEQWLAAAKQRRSVYGLTNTSKISDGRIQKVIEDVLSFTPSSYNTQPLRIVLVTGAKQAQLWDIVATAAEPILKAAGEEVWNKMNGMFQMFKNTYGSVVFFDDTDVITESGKTHASAAHMFEEFSHHASGMAQILVWTALEIEGLGANLQHMNAIPPVEAAIKTFLGVPESYKLRAHLNFGDEAQDHPTAPAKLSTSKTLKIIN